MFDIYVAVDDETDEVIGAFSTLERAKAACVSMRIFGERLSWTWEPDADDVKIIRGLSSEYRDPNQGLDFYQRYRFERYPVRIVQVTLDEETE